MWKKSKNSLYRKIKFDDFDQAADFVNNVFGIAKRLDHHPRITSEFSTVEIWLSTHSAGNKVTEKDETFAKKVDDLLAIKSESTEKLRSAKLFTDGGSRGNPGPSAIGYVISNLDDNVVKKYSKYIGESTNNKAEYTALLEGVKDCWSMNIKLLEVFMDSELIINQLTGKYKVKNKDLKPIYLEIKKLEVKFDKVTYIHVPREQNTVADGLVNDALDKVL